jgi:hypothetical protein
LKKKQDVEKIDVQSIFDEQCLEYNSYEDEKEVISGLVYFNEKEYYDER